MDRSQRQTNLLVIDDDQLFCAGVREALQTAHLHVFEAHTCTDGLARCAREKIDIVLLDQQLPDGDGVGLCPKILAYNDRTKIVFITAYPCFDNVLSAIKHGAYDYLTKPIDIGALEILTAKALRFLDLERVEQAHDYRQKHQQTKTVLIGTQGGLYETQKHIRLAAENLLPVLITGETGTGKSLIAQLIHQASPLNRQAFIQINCAAIPENLMESELFGHEKGAFTGAVSARKGIFELAEGGTLLLDEIGELPLHLQSKLLGVLDDSRVRRLGGQVPRHINVRVIAATNIDLNLAVKEGRFRQDLFYRLGVILISPPPLRNRLQDLPRLCDHLIGAHRQREGIHITDDEIQRLTAYSWPGNVRELKNVIERSIILRNGPDIRPSQLLNQHGTAPAPVAAPTSSLLSLQQTEHHHIRTVLAHTAGNHSQAAKILGISRSTLLRKLATAAE